MDKFSMIRDHTRTGQEPVGTSKRDSKRIRQAGKHRAGMHTTVDKQAGSGIDVP